MELTPEEARVVGALAEKQLTTPQYYPLTLNALVNACNQTSNRNPVVSYDDATVERALQGLRDKGLARAVLSPGNRAPKYRHLLEEALALVPEELAIFTVLLLRGPQTTGELRTRTERMYAFSSLDEVEATLDRLATRHEEPLAERLERQPGQKEARYAHLLGGRAPEPRFRQPDYIVLVVEDLDAAAGFWSETMGLELDHRSGPYAQFSTGATRFGLFERAAMEETLGGLEGERFEVGFKVSDCDRAYEELVAGGAAPVVAPTDRAWGQRTGYVRDPDGHLIELAQDL